MSMLTMKDIAVTELINSFAVDQQLDVIFENPQRDQLVIFRVFSLTGALSTPLEKEK